MGILISKGIMKEENQHNQPINQSTIFSLLLKLSRSEGRVLEQAGKGKTNEEIAEELCLSIRTVETHRYRIRRTLKMARTNTLENWMKDAGL